MPLFFKRVFITSSDSVAVWLSPFECVCVFMANCPVEAYRGKYRRKWFRGLCHYDSVTDEQETFTKLNKVQGWRWPRSKKGCHWGVRPWPTFIWMPTNLYKCVVEIKMISEIKDGCGPTNKMAVQWSRVRTSTCWRAVVRSNSPSLVVFFLIIIYKVCP